MGEEGGGASPLPPPHRAREARPVKGILGAAITLIKVKVPVQNRTVVQKPQIKRRHIQNKQLRSEHRG